VKLRSPVVAFMPGPRIEEHHGARIRRWGPAPRWRVPSQSQRVAGIFVDDICIGSNLQSCSMAEICCFARVAIERKCPRERAANGWLRCVTPRKDPLGLSLTWHPTWPHGRYTFLLPSLVNETACPAQTVAPHQGSTQGRSSRGDDDIGGRAGGACAQCSQLDDVATQEKTTY
jgi:hypothetical protein